MVSNADAGKIKFLGAMQGEPVALLPKIIPAGKQNISAAAFIRPWQGLGLRSGVASHIKARLEQSLRVALSNSRVVSKLEAIGNEVKLSSSSKEMQDLYLADLTKWTEFIKTAKIKAD
jgi:tripartite-type tricarboxylate transporter receptor subunit TctC